MIPRLKKIYEEQIRQSLMMEFSYKNVMQIPRFEKVVLNMGIGEAVNDRKKIQSAVEELALIAGQRPIITRARKSLASFKLRAGMNIGCKVTLRGDRMYEFLDRLINIALPRVRDFRGLSVKSFDGYGNYALGIKEQIIFPEIHYDKIESIRGMDVVICTTAATNKEGYALLKHLNMPFIDGGKIG